VLTIVPPKVIDRRFQEEIEAAFNECLRRGYLEEEPGTVLHYALHVGSKVGTGPRTWVALWKCSKKTGELLGGVALIDPRELLSAVPVGVLRGVLT
jgi:hypothetical protein